MPIYRNADRLVLFVHIPKTGGSTVEEVLKARGARQALKYHKRLGYANATPQHMPWEVTRHWVTTEFCDYIWAVVRNPYNRLLSEYRWRETLSKQDLVGFDEWVNKTFDQYAATPYMLDNHIRPQVEFVSKSVKVFRLEDGLEKAVEAGLAALAMPVEGIVLHHKRKSKHEPVEVAPATVDRIRQFYAEDFINFDYDPAKLPAMYRSPKSVRNLFGLL